MALIGTASPDTTSLTNKFLFIDAPSLDKGKLEKTLLLRSFTGYEGISQLFTFHLDLLSKDPDIDFDKIVGQNVTIGFKLSDGTRQRPFNGFISRFVQLPSDGRLGHYQAEMVPWLWFLSRTADCRIFANMTVPKIVLQVFQDFGFKDVEKDGLKEENYTKWEYCVQYRETALNFVMRLMEQEGIFFFFRHKEGTHTLVLADARSRLDKCPNQSTVKYQPYQGTGAAQGEETVRAWQRRHEFRPGKYAIKEYNYEKPGNKLLSTVKTTREQAGNVKYEIFDYPGEYELPDEGDGWVKLRMEEEEVAQTLMTGESGCRSFAAGFEFDLSQFELYEPRRANQNGSYRLLSVSHDAHESGFYSGASENEAGYANVFTCIPSSIPFRPPRITPKPVIQGSQTAVVVGPQGEEIYTDEYGRVRVQFHWDRSAKHSCWMRVAQPWAGKGWGAVLIPRIGDEVVVSFLEGDPDRPLVTGCVYNNSRMSPYKLPDNQTQSGIKTRSTKGGGADNFNELRFEDKKGAEEIVIHAERNLRTTVEADESCSVGHDRSTTIGHDDILTVQNDQKVTIKEGNADLHVDSHNRVVIVKEQYYLLAKNIYEEATEESLALKAAAGSVAISAATSISLNVGPNSIVLDKSGITLSGRPLIKLNT